MIFKVLAAFVLLQVVRCQTPKLVQEPQSVEISEGDEVVLTCQFDSPAKECVWLKDGELTIVREPYHYVGDPNTGDCSIRISKVGIGRDDGSWQCQFPRLGNTPAVSSKAARIDVMVSPQDPTIFYEGDVLDNGGTLSLAKPNDNTSVLCVSKSGNPAALLYWMIDSQKMDGMYKNESVNENSNQKLYNSESHLVLPGGSHLRGSQIKCVAEHPTYNGRLHEAYGYIQVHQNTTQVSSSLDGFFKTSVEVEEESEITLFCSADGVPEPTYTWEFQRTGSVGWEAWGNQQNLTTRAIAGKYLCRAGNDYNIERIAAPDELVVETKARVITPQNSASDIRVHTSLALVLSTLLFGFLC